ncbi:MAG: alkaline phosphatase family protein [archaeon]|nr:alkaline phosphatase family protein [archaeon]
MKGVFVVLDGLGDLPNKQLREMTPLEAAETPNLDFLNARGEIGYMYPVKPSFIPDSDEAIISLFGNDLISSSRGQLEAAGTDVKITRGDLALRANFATIDSLKSGNILDRRAGRTLTTKEAEILAKDLNNKIKLPMKFVFKSTIQHRGVLILKGGFSDNISSNDISSYEQGVFNQQDKLKICRAMDDEDNSQYTANVVNEFLNQAYEILDKHPVNEQRRKKGLPPANYILVRGAGIEIPKLKLYKKWISCAYMPLEIGFSKLSGMKTYSFEYPKFNELDVYQNLHEGLKEACKFSIEILKNNYKKADYAYIHIKETDVPGHDNKPIEKKEMIEFLDANLFKFLKDFATQNNINIIVTGDHSTPCRLKAHSADPVPVLFYNHSLPKENRKFCEKNARLGTLGRMNGNELLKKLGFLE